MTEQQMAAARPGDGLQALSDSEIDQVGGAMGISDIVSNVGRTLHLIQIGIALTIGLLASPKCN